MSNRWSIVLAAVTASLVVPSVAEACTCDQPSLSRSWHESTHTFKGIVLDSRVRGSENQYRVRVQRTFSGCTVDAETVIVSSNTSAAACGLPLAVGQTWLLTADLSEDGTYAIGSCGYNRVWSTLSETDRSFLASRPVVCEDEPGSLICADGSEPVQCFADACQVENACAAAEICEFNSCGGCNAEFYDESWNPVCE